LNTLHWHDHKQPHWPQTCWTLHKVVNRRTN